MKRYNVHLSNVQIREIKSVSQQTGLLASEIIRRAIDMYLEERRKKIREEKSHDRQNS